MSDEKDRLTQLAQAAADGEKIIKSDQNNIENSEAYSLISRIKQSFVSARDDYEKPIPIKPGDHWGHLSIISEIGAGGMGLVYKAYDELLDRTVAVKFLNPKSKMYTSSVEFIAEARRIAKVRHPNILAIHGANTYAQITGFWSELIEGVTLDQYLKNKPDWQQILKLSQDLSRAIHVIHDNQIIHGDIKPLNIMVDDTQRATLMDFGSGIDLDRSINQVSSSTPLIMAPELFTGSAKNKQSDVYALGVVFYFLSSGGQYPHNANSLSDLERSVNGGNQIDYKCLTGPTKWINLVRSMLNINPDKRPPTAEISRIVEVIKLAPAKRAKKVAVYSLIIFLLSTTAILLYSNYSLDQAQIKTQSALNETTEVNRLMTDMLSSVSPVVKGKDVLMLDVIDQLIVDTQNNEAISAQVKAKSLLTLAMSLNGLGQSAQAISMLELLQQNSDIDSKLRIEIICAHVQFLLKQSKGAETSEVAQNMIQQANALRSSLPVEVAYLNALVLHAQAQIDLALNLWDAAESNTQNALQYWQSLPPSKSTNRQKGILFNDLGTIAKNKSQFGVAASFYKSAADNFASFGQSFNSNILVVKNNLAINLRVTGKLDEAIKLYQELASQAETYIGTNHLIYWKIMQNLAAALNDANRITESIEILESISPQIIKHYGTQSDVYVSIRTTLANNLKALKDFDAAENIYNEIIGISKQLFHDKHSEVLINQYNLAELYYESGKPEKAIELLNAQLPVSIDSLGEKHIISIYMTEALAWSHHLLGHHQLAVKLMQQAVDLKQSVYGENNEITLQALQKQAEIEAAFKLQ